MKAALLIAALLGMTAFGCSKDKERETKLRRSGGKAAVVLIGAEEELGESVKEAEPNNELEQAQGVPLGTVVTGSLEGSLDLDRYELLGVVEGTLFVKLDGAEDADLKLELQKADGSSLARSDRGPAGSSEGIAGYWLEDKGEYQIVVSEFTKKKARKAGGRKGPSARYRLRLEHKSSAEQDYELEPNEDLEGAKEVGAGQEGFGYIGWAGDSDWWRIPVSGFSEVVVDSAEGDAPASQRALDIVVSGMDRVATAMQLTTATGDLLVSCTATAGSAVSFRSLVPDATADFYILKLGAKRSNPDENYRLSIEEAVVARGNELEPNGTLDSASPLVNEDGVLSIAKGEASLGDVDMFALAPAAMNRSLDLRLEGPVDANLDLSIVTDRGAVVARSEEGGVGASEAVTAVNVLPGQSLTVIVRAKKVVMPAAYRLSYSASEGQGVPQTLVAPEVETSEAVE